MANKTILMIKIRQIFRLYTQGKSKRQISVLASVSRNTVKKYITQFIKEKLTYDSIVNMLDHELESLFGHTEPPKKDERIEQLQQLLPAIEKQMKRKGARISTLWRAYKQANPEGFQLTQFYRYYNHFASRVKPFMHIEHKAGDKMYVDFAGEKLSITDKESGEVQEVEVFAAILGCSQLTYVEAVHTQRREDLIGACENALHFFGGVPAAIVPDNLKSAVTKSSKYEPTLNETFADFADHYGTSVLPARAYRPRDKSLVEGIVKIIYQRIYTLVRSHVYFDLESLNKAISHSLDLHNNAPFKGQNYSRRQQFEDIERASLQPLPAYRYEFKQQAIVTVMKNGHIGLSLDKHYYSVPYRFIGKKVKMLFTASLVEIFYRYEQIASHPRQFKKYHYTTLDEHLASAHRYVSEWTPEKFIEQGRTLHPDVAEYITLVIENKQHPEQAYKSCSGILGLARKVGSERLVNACRRAHSFGIYNYPIIVQILDKNLDRLNEEENQQELPFLPDHHNIRGSGYYK
jgi:Transposase and inactivated derivatives